jgi:hypothetical protein
MDETTVSATPLSWQPAEGYHPGTLRKILRRGAKGEPRTIRLKLPRV